MRKAQQAAEMSTGLCGESYGELLFSRGILKSMLGADVGNRWLGISK